MELKKSKAIGEILEKLASKVLTDKSSPSDPESIISTLIMFISKTHGFPSFEPSIFTDDIVKDVEGKVVSLRAALSDDRRTLESLNYKP